MHKNVTYNQSGLTVVVDATTVVDNTIIICIIMELTLPLE